MKLFVSINRLIAKFTATCQHFPDSLVPACLDRLAHSCLKELENIYQTYPQWDSLRSMFLYDLGQNSLKQINKYIERTVSVRSPRQGPAQAMFPAREDGIPFLYPAPVPQINDETIPTFAPIPAVSSPVSRLRDKNVPGI